MVSDKTAVKILSVTLVLGMFASPFGLVGTASATLTRSNQSVLAFQASGSGLAGSGSVAVVSFFSLSRSTGGGVLSGDIGNIIGHEWAELFFSLTVTGPANAPILPCPSGEVSYGGEVTSGSFLGDQVIVASCVGSGVPAAILIRQPTPDELLFSGSGTGSSTLVQVQQGVHASEVLAAGSTSGSGTAGSGGIQTAEIDEVLSDGSLLVEGAFTGTVSLAQLGNTWAGNKAVIQPGCTLATSGVADSFGSFSHQPIASSYTLTNCPPTTLAEQPASLVWQVGSDKIFPIYFGTGTAAIEIAHEGF